MQQNTHTRTPPAHHKPQRGQAQVTITKGAAIRMYVMLCAASTAWAFAFGAFWWQVCNPSALALSLSKKAFERERGRSRYAASP